MNNSNPRADHHEWERDISDGFHATMNTIRTEDVPRDSVERSVAAAAELGRETVPPNKSLPDQRIHASRRLSPKLWPLLAVAATLLLGASLVFTLLSQRSAWAQVLESVAQQPWMRLTMQEPERAKVTMWFSADHKVAALQKDADVIWVDIANGDEHRFLPQSGRIVIAQLKAWDSAGIQRLLTALAPFDANLEPAESSSLRRQRAKESQVTVDGTTYVDFEFQFQATPGVETAQRNAINDETVTVRVNKATKQPVEATLNGATFAIDFPASGPRDIYALGIQQDTPVDDLRELEKYFRERPSLQHADYEAIEIMVLAGMEGKWINEAKRFRSKGGKTTCENADFEQIRKLADSVYYADGNVPTGKTHDALWWMLEASKLKFESAEWNEFNFPHDRCYAPYGGVRQYRSVHMSKLKGLEGTVELRGPEYSVWLDPERDMIVRRSEHVNDDGTISVRQYDKVIRDKNGVWFVTRWRNGRVTERGGRLPETFDRNDRKTIATTVHICGIDFE